MGISVYPPNYMWCVWRTLSSILIKQTGKVFNSIAILIEITFCSFLVSQDEEGTFCTWGSNLKSDISYENLNIHAQVIPSF